MPHWVQQLNFAVWCATTACGISREFFEKDNSTLNLPPHVRAFYLFHVYFTIGRILFQMGVIQSISAQPGDPTFSQKNNKYDVASYTKYAPSSESNPQAIFVSNVVKITVWGMGFTCTSHTSAQRKYRRQVTQKTTSSAAKVERRTRGTLYITSKTMNMAIISTTDFARTARKV